MSTAVEYIKCPYCYGSGVLDKKMVTSGGYRIYQVTCSNCNGTGKVVKRDEE